MHTLIILVLALFKSSQSNMYVPKTDTNFSNINPVYPSNAGNQHSTSMYRSHSVIVLSTVSLFYFVVQDPIQYHVLHLATGLLSSSILSSLSWTWLVNPKPFIPPTWVHPISPHDQTQGRDSWQIHPEFHALSLFVHSMGRHLTPLCLTLADAKPWSSGQISFCQVSPLQSHHFIFVTEIFYCKLFQTNQYPVFQ